MSNCIPYKIQVSSVGVSTDLFSIKYITVGDPALQTALNACGDAALLLTSAQLLNGYTVCLPANVDKLYIYDVGGTCDGRYTSISF